LVSAKKWYVPVTLVCLLSGILLAMQLKVQATINVGPQAHRNESLVGIIRNLEKETGQLEEQIAALRKQLDLDQKLALGSQDKLLTLQEEMEQAKAAAGLTDLAGPGLVITLDDNLEGAAAAKIKDPERYRDEDYIIHDKNLLYLVNDLKVGGAEAIAIGGTESFGVNTQRLVATSDIRCAGTMILVNTTRLAPPYVITAIGNQDSLIKALMAPESEFLTLKALQFPISFKKEDLVKIPAYKGGFRFNYSQPGKEGAG
jgi:uncharacterized protein YlxW (UPF0749 family)